MRIVKIKQEDNNYIYYLERDDGSRKEICRFVPDLSEIGEYHVELGRLSSEIHQTVVKESQNSFECGLRAMCRVLGLGEVVIFEMIENEEDE